MNIVVRPLWEDTYRVNVYVKDGLVSRISDSYFVKTKDGLVVSARPEIRDNLKGDIETSIKRKASQSNKKTEDE